MTDSSTSAIVGALRTAIAATEAPSTSDVLVRSAGQIIFDKRALAPPSVVAQRALLDHLQVGKIDESDEVALKDWESAVSVSIDLFLMDPLAAIENECDDFLEGCGAVFGTEAADSSSVLMCFRDLTPAERVGVFLSIDRSTTFAFLAPLIDEAPGDTPFENPARSMRTLLSMVFAEH